MYRRLYQGKSTTKINIRVEILSLLLSDMEIETNYKQKKINLKHEGGFIMKNKESFSKKY